MAQIFFQNFSTGDYSTWTMTDSWNTGVQSAASFKQVASINDPANADSHAECGQAFAWPASNVIYLKFKFTITAWAFPHETISSAVAATEIR